MANNLTPPEPPADPTVVQQPAFVTGRRYMIDADLKPIIEGKVLLPNFERLPAEEAVKRASYWYGHVNAGRAKLDSDFPSQALYFLSMGQGGGLLGDGMVMTVGWHGDKRAAIAGTFAICKHQKVDGPGANHNRGWHPGYCKLCGVDLSVDSGD